MRGRAKACIHECAQWWGRDRDSQGEPVEAGLRMIPRSERLKFQICFGSGLSRLTGSSGKHADMNREKRHLDSKQNSKIGCAMLKKVGVGGVAAY